MLEATTVGLAVSISAFSFSATNLENLFLLLVYLHQPKYTFRTVFIGYIAATGLILFVSQRFSQMAQVMPSTSIHYLGFLPIVMGMGEFFKRVLKPKNSSARGASNFRDIRFLHPSMTVGTVTLTSGGDTFLIFASLFADTRFSADLVVLLTGIGMAGFWMILARWLVRRSWLSAKLHRWGDFLLPLLLITVGLFILMDTPVDLD